MSEPSVYFESPDVTIWHGDARTAWEHLPERSANAIVTSPPYWGLRDYGVEGQIGLEDDPTGYITELANTLTAYGEHVLRPDGSLWLNLGDTYAAYNNNRGSSTSISGGGREVLYRDRPGITGDMPAKCLLMVPERVALALIERGWILRNKIVWHKTNGLPSSAKDRLVNRWEHLLHFTRSPRYHYDLDALREPHTMRPQRRPSGRPIDETPRPGQHKQSWPTAARDEPGFDGHPLGKNPGDVWTIPTKPFPGAHFATFPPELVRRPILATVPERACAACLAPVVDGTASCDCAAERTPGVVLDPFFGSGTTAVMARQLGRRTFGIELNRDYCEMAADRFRQGVLDLGVA